MTKHVSGIAARTKNDSASVAMFGRDGRPSHPLFSLPAPLDFN